MSFNLSQCGTVVCGIKTPFILRGDDLLTIIWQSLVKTIGKENIDNGDIIAVTEAVLALAQEDIVSKKDVAESIKKQLLGSETLIVLWPIFSRNRFAPILDCLALAMKGKKIILQLNAFVDEQGNNLFNREVSLPKEVRGWDEETVRSHFGSPTHMITGKDYLQLYRHILEDRGVTAEIFCSNQIDFLLKKYPQAMFLIANVHGREKAKSLLKKSGLKKVLTLQDLKVGKENEWGLLGSNGLNQEELKLFPHQAENFVQKLQNKILQETGKKVEALIYGDGAFKDPISGIWELADPVCSPGFSAKLAGSPQEIKLKAVLNDQLKGEKDQAKLKSGLLEMKKNLSHNQEWRFGTTPRRFCDLLASLADLTSGSGDKGTPVIYIKNYF